MSARDPGVVLAGCAAQIVELAAFRRSTDEVERVAAGRGLRLPSFGASTAADSRLALCVRPARWLILAPPSAPGSEAALWQEPLTGVGAAVDLSGALNAFLLTGSAVPAVLARACRLDLRAAAFPAGSAAATIMVQVPVTLAAVQAGMLLLTPATTARHLREWLMQTAGPFGLECSGDRSI